MNKTLMKTIAIVLMFTFIGCYASVAEEGKMYALCADNSFPPFEYWDGEAGRYAGVDVELIEAIARDQGFQYTLTFIGFDASCGSVQSGQADAVIGPLSITEDRKLVYDFSIPYFHDGQIMAVSAHSTIATLEDLKGKSVAAKNGTMGAQYAERNQAQYGYTIQYYDDSPSMYQAVATGINAACFEDFSVMAYAIGMGVDLEMVGDVINPVPCAYAVKKGTNEELLKCINEGLSNLMENGIYQEVLSKYGLTVVS